MGHKRIDETMRYVHFAEHHARPLPDSVLAAGDAHRDPDRRVISMLGARGLGSQRVLGGDQARRRLAVARLWHPAERAGATAQGHSYLMG